MKKKLLSILLLAAMGTTMSCSGLSEKLGLAKPEEDNSLEMLALLGLANLGGSGICNVSISPLLNASGNITASTTWPASTLLTGVVTVKSGATLTIPAGAYVYGSTGTAIYVEPGAKINAVGTSTSPVCFTSAQAVGSRKSADWGGLIISGNATGSRTAAAAIEGGNNFGNPTYGPGAADTDNSGTLQYVVVDFAGQDFGGGVELNGYSLYDVGSGTTIDHIQSNMGRDDGVELWGGKVNLKYVLVTGSADDDLDIDEGYQGKVQYMIGQKFPASCGLVISTDPRGFEMDGTPSGAKTVANGGTYLRATDTKISNFTLLGQRAGSDTGMFLREGFKGTLTHGIVYGFTVDRTASNKTGGEPTAVNFKDILTESGNTADQTSIEAGNDVVSTTINSTNVTDTVFASSPVPGAVGSTCGTSHDFTPVGLAATAADVSTDQGGDAFFTNNSTYGAVVGGDTWWNGWAAFHNN